MIRRFLSVVFLIALGGALTYFGLRYHYVMTSDRMLVVEKTEMSFTDTYADVRDWSAGDFQKHPELVRALIEGGHTDLVPAQLSDKLRNALENLFRNSAAPPRETSTDTGTGQP